MEKRPYPLFLYATGRLLPRMDVRNPKYQEISGQQATTYFGLKGEWRADKYIRRFPLPAGSLVLHDLTLRILGSDPVQFDTLIITKSVVYVMEIKNIHGGLSLEESPARLKRIASDGNVHFFPSPIIQLNNAIDALSYWLMMHDVQIPVEGGVFLASKHADARFPAGSPVHFVTEIPARLKMALHGHEVISDQTANWIASALRKQEEVFHPYPLTRFFDVSVNSLFTDPLCEDCNGRLITETNRKGVCQRCGKSQWLPFISTLVDYFLIFHDTITSKDCEDFLGVKATTAKGLLKSPLFKRNGQASATFYELDVNRINISDYGKLILPKPW